MRKYQVASLHNHSSDLCIFSLDGPTIDFLPGQYVNLGLSQEDTAPFSIASRTQPLEFHLRHSKSNPQAARFYQSLLKNEALTLDGPFGRCLLPEENIPLIFIAGGSGIAPHKALIEQAIEEDRFESIHLYWGLKSTQDRYLDSSLQRFQKHPAFKLKIILSEKQESWTGPYGLVHTLALEDPLLSKARIFASGPYPMIQSIKETLSALKIPLSALYSDMS